MLGAAASVAWLLIVYPSRPGPGKGAHLVLDLGPGTDVHALADRLARGRVLDHAWLFATYMHILGADARLRHGRVEVSDVLTPAQIARRVALGLGQAVVRITIPEGWTRFDIARRLDAHGVCKSDAFLRATSDPDFAAALGVKGPTLEGYLFPNTYELREGEGPRTVARRMVEDWHRRVGPLLSRDADRLGALHEGLNIGVEGVVTLASIVEKEAVKRDEQPVIAGVFLNRLRSPDFEPKRLQADPTVAYGCIVAPTAAPSCAAFDGHLTPAMLHDPLNPYNTYRREGLPPGPIANPGLPAVRAVLEPDTHHYLYFVARGGGRHHFSVTLAEHNAAIARYLKRRDGADERQ